MEYPSVSKQTTWSIKVENQRHAHRHTQSGRDICITDLVKGYISLYPSACVNSLKPAVSMSACGATVLPPCRWRLAWLKWLQQGCKEKHLPVSKFLFIWWNVSGLPIFKRLVWKLSFFSWLRVTAVLNVSSMKINTKSPARTYRHPQRSQDLNPREKEQWFNSKVNSESLGVEVTVRHFHQMWHLQTLQVLMDVHVLVPISEGQLNLRHPPLFVIELTTFPDR